MGGRGVAEPDFDGEEADTIVLLSGGMDSAVVLYDALAHSERVYTVTFDYGQRNAIELTYARRLYDYTRTLTRYLVGQSLVKLSGLNLPSALTDETIDVPENLTVEEALRPGQATEVPARNMIFLAIAIGYAKVLGARRVAYGGVYFTGTGPDSGGFADNSPSFVSAMQTAGMIATGSGIQVSAPLIDHTKLDIFNLAKELGVPLDLTWSCYHGGPKPCGKCDACINRLENKVPLDVPSKAR